MGHGGDGDDVVQLRSDLVDETLEECERLLGAAEAAAAEIRQTAHRHAQARAEGAIRALTVAAERLHQEAADDRSAAREAGDQARRALADARRLGAEADAELEAGRQQAQRMVAEAAAGLRDASAAQAALLAEADDRATALQAELLAEADDEIEHRLAQLDREVAAARAEAEAAREALLRQAEDDAAQLVAAAQRSADEERRRADEAVAVRLAEADRAVEERLSSADRTAAGRLADAERRRTAVIDDAHRMASDVLAEADLEAATMRTTAESAAAAIIADAERRTEAILGAAGEQASDAHAARDAAEETAATDQILAAYREAHQIIKGAEVDAAEIRATARSVTGARDGEHDDSRDEPPAPGARRGHRRRARWGRNLRILALLVVVLAGAEALRSHVAEPYTVAATSMEPQLRAGDRLVVNKLAFRLGEPALGDVVVFDTADVPGAAGAPGRTLVKRVIAVSGEVVQGLDGAVVVDGEVIDDPWSAGVPTPAFGPVRMPDATVYVLGDNRALSVDSRTFGAVPIDALTGRVEAVIWPLDRAGRV